MGEILLLLLPKRTAWLRPCRLCWNLQSIVQSGVRVKGSLRPNIRVIRLVLGFGFPHSPTHNPPRSDLQIGR